MKLYPESAEQQLEFSKIKNLLAAYCDTDYAKEKVSQLRIHTKKEIIQLQLQQAHECKLVVEQGQSLPNNFSLNLNRSLKLLSIEGGVLQTEDFINIRKLAANTERIFRWFDAERRLAYAALYKVLENSYYEKTIMQMIDEIFDDGGNIKDNASEALQKIRQNLFRKRNELRRVFEKAVARLNRAGYSAEIEESFSNGRRVVAVFSEYKRQVKGILHGESDSRKTAFIEPEETIELNNEVFSLENEEKKEIYRILKQLTANLSVYGGLLLQWLQIAGEYDFINAKAKFGIDIKGNFPNISDKAIVDLREAYHPLLLLHNKQSGRQTIPVTLRLDEQNRLLVISGPNAGGKTVTMKTIGLNQVMLQSGLLVPVHHDSEMGIFKQLFIHIGDTQSIEFDLSTYSSHLLHMKYFIEHANGKTLFFIDELGSGTDPNLGGAFAEIILNELNRKHAFGIVTTHYLNLKTFANKTPGIINGSMMFDEENLQPLFKLSVGKPGSSYTFAIAERIGLPKHLIANAKKLVDENHFRLDKLLNRTEKDLQTLQKEKLDLKKLLSENEQLKKQLSTELSREKHRQQIEVLKLQNKVTEERIAYLREMERKLKQIVLDWKKTENKNEVIKQLQELLFKRKDNQVKNRLEKKIESKYRELQTPVSVGSKVKMKKNFQVGEVKEIRGKRAVVQIGMVPINIDLNDLVPVEEK
ncbi:endonuclease MutS2 [Parafilimonas terrae]|uniref:DNA mismatch repair protein MutS2 n=1 Tax=Parafilimonas terrae TaxID=1465490 RepID=A0A1I5TS63_9BACT|nr:DNA mismatch repair protein MutS [Parafilimonas terrae]SFP85900.1 DNA mismatch repair protein MutS2 [Parafilimonas terrae]